MPVTVTVPVSAWHDSYSDSASYRKVAVQAPVTVGGSVTVMVTVPASSWHDSWGASDSGCDSVGTFKLSASGSVSDSDSDGDGKES